jgi:hypothetical protein
MKSKNIMKELITKFTNLAAQYQVTEVGTTEEEKLSAMESELVSDMETNTSDLSNEDHQWLLGATNEERCHYYIAMILAFRFSQLLKEITTLPGFRLMVKSHEINDAVNSAYCVSHNYCDANIVMLDAFNECAEKEFDINSESDNKLWNMAWRIAKEHNFFKDKLLNEQ